MSLSISPPSWFRGRAALIQRVKARLDHYRLFVFAGNSGVGKTTLLLRLAQETKAQGCEKAVYLQLAPGESINSVLARVEARFPGRASTATTGGEKQGDPFSRLVEVLDRKKVVLILDDLHHLREQDLPAMTRVFHAQTGNYRVLCGIQGEPELSAMDRMLLHMERIGGLTPAEVGEVLSARRVSGDTAELLVADAARGGCSGHPMTLQLFSTLLRHNLPDEGFLSKQSSRSVAAFRKLFEQHYSSLGAEEQSILEGLAAVGMPLSIELTEKIWSSGLKKILSLGLVADIDGELYLHSLVRGVVGQDTKLDAGPAKKIASQLKKQGLANNEPVTVIRAGEILARAGMVSEAVELLGDTWDDVRDLGFLEAFLKTLSKVAETADDPSLNPKLKLMAARARMRQGNVRSVRADMEALVDTKDAWTKQQALRALIHIYHESREHELAMKAYHDLAKTGADHSTLLLAGPIAARSMLQLGKWEKAEGLALDLLKEPGKKNEQIVAELHRILARVYSESGRLKDAVHEAQAAATAFEKAGDLYHAATAHGFIGDLYRNSAEFEKAKEAFQKFRELAGEWGERDLIQVAELADAWVSIDIGDLNYAQKQVEAVEKEISAAASRRLRRYLGAAKALVMAGQGDHEGAARSLKFVIDQWKEAGQHTNADLLRASLVRSLLALGQVDEAEVIVTQSLERLDEKSAGPRVALFLRESALIQLQKHDNKKAMESLAKACKLFKASGNRREEVMTLYRIAQAALQQDDLKLASERAKEAMKLAQEIKHHRAIALASEVAGKVSLAEGDAREAVVALKSCLSSLKKLGDELGTLHVSEALLRAYVVSGDLSNALKLGPKVADHAEKLELRDTRIRAIVYTGVAMLRRDKIAQAEKCFKEMAPGSVSPTTELLMWRLGEALAIVGGSRAKGLERREHWSRALRRMPKHRHDMALRALEQLALPPRDQAVFRGPNGDELVGTEDTGYIDPSNYPLYIDVYNRRIFSDGKRVDFRAKDHPRMSKLLFELVVESGEMLSHERVYRIAEGSEWKGSKVTDLRKKNKDTLAELQRILRTAKQLKFKSSNDGFQIVLPENYAIVIPTTRSEDVSTEQRKMIQLLRKQVTLPLQVLQDETKLAKTAARAALAELEEMGLVEAVRDGRGQAFRLI